MKHQETTGKTKITVIQKPISLESRRYIGSKAKLTEWIMDLINKETKNVNTYKSIFYRQIEY